MRRVARLFLLVMLVWPCSASPMREGPLEVAKSFMPPGAELAQLPEFDERTGEHVRDVPAVFVGHIVARGSEDIVLAYFTRAPDMRSHSLFVALLHKTPKGYAKLYELTYYEQVLLSSTSGAGLRLVKLPPSPRDSIAVWAGFGASLGGRLQVFRWGEPGGLENIMPENADVRHVSYHPSEAGFTITLSYERTGVKGLPGPLTYRWNGAKFMEVRKY